MATSARPFCLFSFYRCFYFHTILFPWVPEAIAHASGTYFSFKTHPKYHFLQETFFDHFNSMENSSINSNLSTAQIGHEDGILMHNAFSVVLLVLIWLCTIREKASPQKKTFFFLLPSPSIQAMLLRNSTYLQSAYPNAWYMGARG